MITNDSPKMQVKCGVENCGYNKNHMCYANSIEIDTLGDRKADSKDSTRCATFVKEQY